MAHAYPILLDLSDRLVVIIGGGAVAARKAHGVVAAGAGTVRCVAKKFIGDFPAEAEQIVQAFNPSHLADAALVFACTDQPEVNDRIVEEACRQSIFVNRADSSEDQPGDFTTPALFHRGEVLVTVSAASPALSAAIRDDLANKLDPRLVKMADAMLTLRPKIRSSKLPIEQRAALFRELAAPAALDRLEAGGIDALLTWLRQTYPELQHG